ncbi:hypothetical protein [Candidatus Bandiella euplotis]|uniref:SAM-dependent methyltransferase n=1 Tax=Candidatus Bandiella euplotis TaxID=1664265 RepID=A0ABZ0UT96_9RICK|nr:hypothetical protein [Candidatus Bandiella woodruffii]WPX97295.1 SAM-dependent methyltransferase [Candidatus Bandiella woodruffii]
MSQESLGSFLTAFKDILLDYLTLFLCNGADDGGILFYSPVSSDVRTWITNKTINYCSPSDYDEDHIVLTQKYNNIVSLLSLHYSNDIIGSLIQYKKYLTNDGSFLAIILGGETLTELKRCLIEVDMLKFGKIYPRIMPMIKPEVIPSLLQRAEYKNSIISVEKVTLYYDGIESLITDIKKAGQFNYLTDRYNGYAGKDYFPKAEELYLKFYGDDKRIPATFEFIIMHSLA